MVDPVTRTIQSLDKRWTEKKEKLPPNDYAFSLIKTIRESLDGSLQEQDVFEECVRDALDTLDCLENDLRGKKADGSYLECGSHDWDIVIPRNETEGTEES